MDVERNIERATADVDVFLATGKHVRSTLAPSSRPLLTLESNYRSRTPSSLPSRGSALLSPLAAILLPTFPNGRMARCS